MKRQTHQAPPSAPAHETVLVTTIGTSPSVLTSTIWALAQEGVVPHRVKVLTTRLGRERLVQQVFMPSTELGGRTVWDTLCSDLEARGIDLTDRLEFAPTPACLRVFTATAPGERIPRELDDITTQAENEQVADAMLETLRGVMVQGTHVIASIAGGRKTVSALFYACVSLVGRSEDRIIHVVVNEPFDRADLKPAFFFPTQKCARLVGANGRPFKARDAKLNVIHVPFVPLANLFPQYLGRDFGRFNSLVSGYREAGQSQSLSALQLIVCRSKPKIEVNGASMVLAPREQLLALFLVEHLLAEKPAFPCAKDLAAALEKWRPDCVSTRPKNDLSDWREKLVRTQIEEQDVRRTQSGLGMKLLAAGHPLSLLAQALPKRGRFALNLRKDQVSVAD